MEYVKYLASKIVTSQQEQLERPYYDYLQAPLQPVRRQRLGSGLGLGLGLRLRLLLGLRLRLRLGLAGGARASIL